MSLGSDTGVVNGQRFTFPTTASYAPISYGPTSTGVPNVSPTMPPFFGGAPTAASGLGLETVGGYGTAGNNSITTQVAAQNPWNWRVSPVLWAVGGLIGALVLLKAIHWRDTTLGGFEERGNVGSVSERAEAEV